MYSVLKIILFTGNDDGQLYVFDMEAKKLRPLQPEEMNQLMMTDDNHGRYNVAQSDDGESVSEELKPTVYEQDITNQQESSHITDASAERAEQCDEQHEPKTSEES